MLVYLDTSVVLAHLLAEDRRPNPAIWQRNLVSSRLLEYEVWNRIHARKLSATHGDMVRATLARIAWIELAPPVLARALDPFGAAVRTLDALHLASVDFLLRNHQRVSLATYDEQMRSAAKQIGVALETI